MPTSYRYELAFSLKLAHHNGVEPFPLAFRGLRSALVAVLLRKQS